MKKRIILCFVFVFILSFIIYYFYSGEFRLKLDDAIYYIFAPRYYIKFEELESVTISYMAENSPLESELFAYKYPQFQNIQNLEITVTDEEFLNLIEHNYNNKIITRRHHWSSIPNGLFQIIINDNLSLMSYSAEGFTLIYDGRKIPIKFNEEIYYKMIEIVVKNI